MKIPKWIPYTYFCMVSFYFGTSTYKYSKGFDFSLVGIMNFLVGMKHSLIDAAFTMLALLMAYILVYLVANINYDFIDKGDDYGFVQVIDI